MANTLRFKRGLVSGIPTAALGEPLFTTDTFDLYIGNGTTNTRFQKYIASGTTSQLLRGDGSLLTMPIVLTSPTNGQVLKYDGTNWVNSADAGVTGSGAAGQVTFWNSASTITGSNNLFWDATNSRLGVGTNTPGNDRLSVVGTGRFTQGLTSSTAFQQFAHYFYNGGGTNDIFASTTGNNAGSGNFAIVNTTNGGRLALLGASDSTIRMGNNTQTAATATNFVLHLATGNISINSASDNGLRFQVTGDGFFSGGLGVGGITYAYEGISLRRNLTGLTVAFGVVSSGTIQSDVTSGAYYFTTGAKTQAAAFTLSNLYHYDATQGTFGASSAVTNQYGFFAGSSIIGATNNYGFYGNIASGTGRWNLYMNGSAANYLNGTLSIGTTANDTGYLRNYATIPVLALQNPTTGSGASDGFQLSASGSLAYIWQYENAAMLFGTNATERMRLDAFGNLGLAVTPSAWRSAERALQIGSYTSVSDVLGYSSIGNNFFANTSNQFIYLNTAATSVYSQNAGSHIWQSAASGTAGTSFSFTTRMTLFPTGNLTIGSTTSDAGFRLDVNGTMRVSGASTFNDIITITKSQNAATNIITYNTTNGTNSYVSYQASSNNAGIMEIGKFSQTKTAYKTSASGDGFIYNSIYGDISILNDFASGAIKLTAGGSSTAHLIINSSGNVGIGTTSPDARLRVAGAINSTQAIFGNVDGRGLAISTSLVGGTNEAGVILNARSSVTSGTFIFQTDGTQRVQIDSTGLIINGGNALEFINSAANAVSAIRPTSGGTSVMSTNSNGLHIAVGTEAAGDLILASNNTERVRLSSNGWFSHTSATNPSSSVTDSYVQYSADVTAGNAAPHFRTENGAVIKIYQETTSVGNSIFSQGGGNSVLDDSTFDGYTLRQIVKALRNQGILA